MRVCWCKNMIQYRACEIPKIDSLILLLENYLRPLFCRGSSTAGSRKTQVCVLMQEIRVEVGDGKTSNVVEVSKNEHPVCVFVCMCVQLWVSSMHPTLRGSILVMCKLLQLCVQKKCRGWDQVNTLPASFIELWIAENKINWIAGCPYKSPNIRDKKKTERGKSILGENFSSWCSYCHVGY